ncbi:Hypothetical predicted protein, partial [Pelobates cultripes]
PEWGRQSIIGTQKLTETFTERAPCRFSYKKMSEEEYQNVDHLRMQTFSHNIKDFKTSSSSRPLQPASFPPPSSRVLYGLATLCVGLLIVTAMLSVYITYQAVKGTDQRPESMLTNLSVTSNSKVESLTHKDHGVKGTDLEQMLTNLSDGVNSQVELLSLKVTGTLGKLQEIQENVKQIQQDYSTVGAGRDKLQSDVQRVITAVGKLLDWAMKQTQDSMTGVCEQGWSHFHLSCYKLFKEEKNWTESKAMCEANESHLVVINSKAEQNSVFGISKWYTWIGLNVVDGKWKWIDGTSYDHGPNHWRVGQPDNWFDPEKMGNEDCARLETSGTVKTVINSVSYDCGSNLCGNITPPLTTQGLLDITVFYLF